MILGGRPNHCRSANVDIFDGIINRRVVARDRLLEGIQVHGQQIDRFDTVFCHHCIVGAAPTQQAAVNGRMQCFYAAIHDFGEAGFVADLDHIEAGFAQCAAGATSGENFNAQFGKAGGERNKSMLIGYA